MQIEEITLEEVLAAREKRAEAQRRLIEKYDKAVISLSMNIAGEVKRSPLIDMAFSHATESIEHKAKVPCLHKEIIKAKTGPEALYVFDCSAVECKEKAMEIEGADPVGRLFDIDVIDVNGEKLSRSLGRTCLVCGGPVTLCSRSRAHGLVAVKNATQKLLLDFASEKLADMAVNALIKEAELSPKPGLVDSLNNGSHKDMDLDMLRRSARVLKPYFVDCVRFGAADEHCIEKLQKAGISAENKMLKETEGINTHKGAIFALGIYLGALASVLVRDGDVFELCKQLVHQKTFIKTESEATHGAIVKGKYKSGGAMEEALSGFPTARKGAIALKESGGDGLYALLKIMEDISDTNLLYRGGPEALEYVHQESSAILMLNPKQRKKALLSMDKECISRNISPGGAADLLALAFLIAETAYEI